MFTALTTLLRFFSVDDVKRLNKYRSKKVSKVCNEPIYPCDGADLRSPNLQEISLHLGAESSHSKRLASSQYSCWGGLFELANRNVPYKVGEAKESIGAIIWGSIGAMALASLTQGSVVVFILSLHKPVQIILLRECGCVCRRSCLTVLRLELNP